MTIDVLAQRVLLGDTLEDKLTLWPSIEPRGIGRDTPLTPGRPVELGLPRGHRRLPPIHAVRLDRDEGRRQVLHELANHELQAIELLAMALLRWPDAPDAFRRGLIGTLRDEQRHCQMYLKRLRACGGTFGDQPVSGFFWKTLCTVETPAAFIAGLSLCFEAANLDFCLHWKQRFEDVGDSATAAVLQAVYEDEIRHVAHGATWMGRMGDGERLDAWQRLLPAPLTPARARGPRFDAEGRRAAGFSEAEVKRLRVAGGSRGRPGRVFSFDAGIEDRLADGSVSKRARAVTADLATLPMFLARAEDFVLAPRPSDGFLAALAEVGFPIPRFADAVPEVASGRVAWGPSPGQIGWDPRWRALSDKCETHQRAVRLEHPARVEDLGRVVDTPAHLEGAWVFKAPFSTSGNRRILGRGAATPAQRKGMERILARSGRALLQPWYDRVFDVSVHVTVGERVRIDGLTRFACTGNGVFQGTWLGPWNDGLDSEVLRWLHGNGRRSEAVGPLLERCARHAGEWAKGLGFTGPLSIDAAVVRTPQGLRVHPWLETNARHTLGRIGLVLRSAVHPRSRGWWRIVPASHPEEPVVLEDGKIRSGRLWTTEARPGARVSTVIEVSEPVR